MFEHWWDDLEIPGGTHNLAKKFDQIPPSSRVRPKNVAGALRGAEDMVGHDEGGYRRARPHSPDIKQSGVAGITDWIDICITAGVGRPLDRPAHVVHRVDSSEHAQQGLKVSRVP